MSVRVISDVPTQFMYYLFVEDQLELFYWRFPDVSHSELNERLKVIRYE